jgi:DNA-3-methyladenine glycosylase I
MTWYCDAARGHPVHGPYHDREYGFPLSGEAALFERLSLEIFQAGLSWLLVLNKRPALARAFAGFEVDRVAAFGETDQARLLQDASIIRNRRKIVAVIDNARAVRTLRTTSGGFAAWLDDHHPQGPDGWLAAFRGTFRFMGAEVVREFLLSTGYLKGAHREDCPVHARILEQRPAWLKAERRAPG